MSSAKPVRLNLRSSMSPSRPKIIYFDYGGVLGLLPEPMNMSKAVANAAGYDDYTRLPSLDPLIESWLCGEFNKSKFIDELNDFLVDAPHRIDDTLYEYLKNEDTLLTPIEPMRNLAMQLKSKGYEIGILSNSSPTSSEKIRAAGLYQEFFPVILSDEVKCKKPSNKIFEISEKEANASGDQILFVDDAEINLLAAQKRGWFTIDASSIEAAIEKLKKLL